MGVLILDQGLNPLPCRAGHGSRAERLTRPDLGNQMNPRRRRQQLGIAVGVCINTVTP